MLKNKKLIRVRVRFIAAGREYECGFSPQSTLRENIEILKKLIGNEIEENFLFTGDEIICDDSHLCAYDQNVSIGSIGITDGTVLNIY